MIYPDNKGARPCRGMHASASTIPLVVPYPRRKSCGNLPMGLNRVERNVDVFDDVEETSQTPAMSSSSRSVNLQ